MEIDKNIGWWLQVRYIPELYLNVTYLDDLAYHLYCQYRKNRQPDNITTQLVMMTCPKVYRRFYDKAILLIRKEKINKIMKKSNERY
jgi:hypothetical protein